MTPTPPLRCGWQRPDSKCFCFWFRRVWTLEEALDHAKATYVAAHRDELFVVLGHPCAPYLEWRKA